MAALPERYAEHWDENPGLWGVQSGPGTAGRRVHVIRESAWTLVAAGLDDVLDRLPVGRVLMNLRHVQEKDGPSRGNFWWRWEDGRVLDRNAGFFVSLGLLVLDAEFRGALAADDLRVLDELLAEAEHWFRHRVFPVTTEKLRYPNAYLGDLTCLWLLAEREQRVDDTLAEAMATSLTYYREQHWGWGEHLSDMYAKICQDEFTALLLYGRRLPEACRMAIEGLMRELMAIDAAFAGGPRVPTIRCYALDHSPRTPTDWPGWLKPYRELMKLPWLSSQGPCGANRPMTHLAHRHGLDLRFDSGTGQQGTVTVPCHGGAQAQACVTSRWRLGAMTRYPIMDEVDHPEWGLHWQTMPVAFWHESGDWAYLQWVTEEDGQPRALPFLVREPRPSCVLSDKHPEAAVGQTFGVHDGREFLILRRLNAIAPTWPWVKESLRMIVHSGCEPIVDRVRGWSRLVVRYPAEVLTVAMRPLGDGPEAELERVKEGEWRWSCTCRLTALRPQRLGFLWYATVREAAAEPPRWESIAGRDARVSLAENRAWALRPWESDPWRAC